jgi:hypothetical protein
MRLPSMNLILLLLPLITALYVASVLLLDRIAPTRRSPSALPLVERMLFLVAAFSAIAVVLTLVRPGTAWQPLALLAESLLGAVLLRRVHRSERPQAH